MASWCWRAAATSTNAPLTGRTIYNSAFGWANISNSLSYNSPFLLGASMVFSSGSVSYSMLFGGCDFYYSGCLSLSNSTYGLSGSGWVYIPTTGSPPPTARWRCRSIRR